MALVFAGGAYSQVSLWVFSFELAFLSFLTQVDRWSGTKKALAFSLQKKRRKQIWQKKRFTSITLPRKLSLGWNDLWSPTETYFFGGKWYISWSECLQWLRPVVLGWIDGKMDGNGLVVEKFGKKIDKALTYLLANLQENGQSHLSNETSSSYGGFKLVSHLHILLWPNDHKNWHHSFRPPKIIQNPSRGAECWKTPRKAPLRYWWWRKLHDVVPGEPFGLRPPHQHSVQPTNPR